MSKQNAAKSWNLFFKTLSENILANIVATVLTSGMLLGGFNYILFDYQAEFRAIDQDSNFFRAGIIELDAATEMNELVKNSWIGKPQFDQLDSILATIKSTPPSEDLNASVKREGLNWLTTQLTTAVGDRGKVSGYSFTSTRIQSLQSSTLEMYDSIINVFREHINLINYWLLEDNTVKNQRLDKIAVRLQDFKTANGRWLTILSSLVSDSDLEQTQAQQKNDELQARLHNANLKFFIAISTIVLGFLGVGFLVAMSRFRVHKPNSANVKQTSTAPTTKKETQRNRTTRKK